MRRAAFHLICNILQHKLHEIQNKRWTNLTERIQQYADLGDYRGFYKILKAVYGLTHQVQNPLHSADGQVLFTDKSSILSHWSEHFQSLFSADHVVQDPVVLYIPQQPYKAELDELPSVKEITKTIDQLRSGKMEDLHYTVSSSNSLSVVGSRANFQVISAMQSSSPCSKTREKSQIAPTIRGSLCSPSQEKFLFVCS